MRHLLSSSKQNQLFFYLNNYWGISFFSEETMRHFIFFQKRLWGDLAQHIINAQQMFFLQQKNQAAHYFFRKKSRASLFLQENIEHIIISTDKNEALHYFFRKKRSTSLFSESNQAFHYFFNNKKLIFFWRNNEVLDFCLKK